MSVKKWIAFGLVGIALMMTQAVDFHLGGGKAYVVVSMSNAQADEDRRVARRTARRTASRQTCGSSWC